MKRKTIKRKIGYLLVIVGIALPLSGFLQISFNELSKDANYNKFIELQKNKEESTKEEENKKAIDYNKSIKGEVNAIDPFDARDYKTTNDIQKNDNEVFAYISIPSLDIKKPIYIGATDANMAKGVATVEGTALPIGEKNTRSVIAGHRGYYRDLMFLNVEELKENDEILIDRAGETLKYRVFGFDVVNPNEWEKLEPIYGKEMITLLTCHPLKPPRRQRLLVNAERVYDQDKEVSVKDVETKESANKRMLLVYIVSVVGILLEVIVIFKFIRFLLS